MNRNSRPFFMRKFAADSIATALFWTVIYAPIFLVTSKSLDLASLDSGSLYSSKWPSAVSAANSWIGFVKRSEREPSLVRWENAGAVGAIRFVYSGEQRFPRDQGGADFGAGSALSVPNRMNGSPPRVTNRSMETGMSASFDMSMMSPRASG